ncbi:unnamed protein product [Fraxinus pennsylvanica]|uniref:2Fe-2S ferredoxin-type domain-containing protein n=1 Tax=Fraxinus pennsylvanica TaxID=56036 RepID=A0AAD2EE50_9LAMI|nr:unnamed protein product [Fraxinus pennsylvanica]
MRIVLQVKVAIFKLCEVGRIMFISKFYWLGAHAIRSLVKAPSFTPRTPYLSLRHKPFCTETGKNADEEKQKHSKISVTFVDKDGEEKHIKVPYGTPMLEAAHENDVELEGACEGSLACSTCRVIVMDVGYYNKLEDPTDEGNDMLDLAFGLTHTSRLGCQIIAKPEINGIRNFALESYWPILFATLHQQPDIEYLVTKVGAGGGAAVAVAAPAGGVGSVARRRQSQGEE